MSTPLRKGWCPGALRPMAARDGLLVRLRITGGILSAERASAIAALAGRLGNGQMDLSARGNLQMRGMSEHALPEVWDALTSLGLLDADAAAEAVRNVLASPLAGCRGGLDIRPVVAALEARLAQTTALHALPTKTLFLVDDGGAPSLAGIPADVRFDRLDEGDIFAIGLGGTRAAALQIGTCRVATLPDRAVAIAHGIIALRRRHPDARRVRDLLRTAGAEALADACGGAPGRIADIASPARCGLVGRQTIGGVATVGLAAPFGRMSAPMLAGAANFAARTPRRELRLTPWRVLVVPDATTPPDLDGFITDAADPRLAVAACVGRDGCGQGTTSTQDDATLLAEMLAALPEDAPRLHVAGCAKGCAHPHAAPLTMVGRGGRYDLVRDGSAADAPSARGLDLGAVRRLLAAEFS